MSGATQTPNAPEAEAPPEEEKNSGGFLKHAAIYGVGAIATQMVSIVLLPLYTRYMTPAEYGVLQLLYRVGDVLNICLMVGGISLAAMNFWCKADSAEERKHVAATIAWLTGAVLIAGLGVVMLFSAPIAQQLRLYEDYPNAGMLLAFGIFAMMLQATTVMPLSLMQARLESTAYLVASLGIAFCQLSAVVVALVVLDAGVWGVILAMATTFAFFGVWLTIREFAKSSPLPDKKLMWEVIWFSLPFIPSGICFFILNSGDQFFLIKYCGAATLGIYALAYRIAKGVVTFASGPLVQVWNARMYDVHKQAECSELFGKVYSRILFGYLLGGLGVILFQDEALMLLGTFPGTAELIAPLILAHFFLIFANLMDSAFYVQRTTYIKPFISLASTVVMVASYWILIPRYEAMGGAVATTIGFAFHWSLTLILAQRQFFVKIEWIRLGVVLAVSVALTLLGHNIADQTLLKGVALVVTLIGFWVSGFIQAEEKRIIVDVLQRSLSNLSGLQRATPTR